MICSVWPAAMSTSSITCMMKIQYQLWGGLWNPKDFSPLFITCRENGGTVWVKGPLKKTQPIYTLYSGYMYWVYHRYIIPRLKNHHRVSRIDTKTIKPQFVPFSLLVYHSKIKQIRGNYIFTRPIDPMRMHWFPMGRSFFRFTPRRSWDTWTRTWRQSLWIVLPTTCRCLAFSNKKWGTWCDLNFRT